MVSTFITFDKTDVQPPVFIAGTFTKWAPVEMDHEVVESEGSNAVEHHYSYKVDIEPGEYQYKFKLGHGDWWALNDSTPSATDNAGNVNNVLKINASTPDLSGESWIEVPKDDPEVENPKLETETENPKAEPEAPVAEPVVLAVVPETTKLKDDIKETASSFLSGIPAATTQRTPSVKANIGKKAVREDEKQEKAVETRDDDKPASTPAIEPVVDTDAQTEVPDTSEQAEEIPAEVKKSKKGGSSLFCTRNLVLVATAVATIGVAYTLYRP